MANATEYPCRLSLVTPADCDAEGFPSSLAEALAGGDVSSLIVTDRSAGDGTLARLIEACREVTEPAGVALLVHRPSDPGAPSGADGVQLSLDNAPDAKVIAALRQREMVGLDGLSGRHDAMTAGELDPDYLFFGRVDGDEEPDIYPPALELAAWWSSVAVIPSVLMGGATLESVTAVARSGVDFVALSRAVWDHPEGPRAAVTAANTLLSTMESAA